MPKSGIAKLERPLKHGVENRREVAGRGIDDLQDFAGRALPSQRLIALGGSLDKLPLQIGDNLLRIG
jgi:hypothetical protein